VNILYMFCQSTDIKMLGTTALGQALLLQLTSNYMKAFFRILQIWQCVGLCNNVSLAVKGLNDEIT